VAFCRSLSGGGKGVISQEYRACLTRAPPDERIRARRIANKLLTSLLGAFPIRSRSSCTSTRIVVARPAWSRDPVRWRKYSRSLLRGLQQCLNGVRGGRSDQTHCAVSPAVRTLRRRRRVCAGRIEEPKRWSTRPRAPRRPNAVRPSPRRLIMPIGLRLHRLRYRAHAISRDACAPPDLRPIEAPATTNSTACASPRIPRQPGARRA
jgi:hypothetical protein